MLVLNAGITVLVLAAGIKCWYLGLLAVLNAGIEAGIKCWY